MEIEEFRNVRISTSVEDEFYTFINSSDLVGLKLEFGVYRGTSINRIAALCPDDETVWGFDSFRGTDETWDKGSGALTKMSNFDMDGVLPNVVSNVKLVAGLFQDTLPEWWAEHRASISLLNIDSDTYAAAIFVLRTLNDGIVPGTLIRFDELCDWRATFNEDKHKSRRYLNWREGEWRALNEWIEEFDREVVAVGRSRSQCGVVRVTV